MIEVKSGWLVNPNQIFTVRKDESDGNYFLDILWIDMVKNEVNYGEDFVARNKVYREFQTYGRRNV